MPFKQFELRIITFQNRAGRTEQMMNCTKTDNGAEDDSWDLLPLLELLLQKISGNVLY